MAEDDPAAPESAESPEPASDAGYDGDAASPDGDIAAGLTGEDETEVTETEETEATEEIESGEKLVAVGPPPLPVRRGARAVAVVGLVSLTVFGGLCGLLGYRLYETRQAEKTRDLLLATARQSAVNLTSIDYERVDADVQRILDSATGTFYDDFKARSGPFIEVIRKVKSKSVGTVSEAGVESVGPQEGRVLLAVSVKTTNVGVPEERPQYWRMRLTLTKQGDEAKVSEVEFVP